MDRSLAFILPGAPDAEVQRSRAIIWPVSDAREAERVFKRLRVAAEDAVDAGAAKAFIEEIEQRARGQVRQQSNTPAGGRLGPTLAEFKSEFLDWARAHNKPSEVDGKEMVLRRHLLPALGHLRLGEIRRREIDRFKSAKLKQGLDPKTVNNIVAVLSKLLKLAVQWEVIDHAPPVGLLKVAKPEFDFLTFDEADRLLCGAEPERETWVMILVAVRTGLRQGELLALQWDDVDLVKGVLHVRRAVARGIVGTPKSNRSRFVTLSPQTVRGLKAHRHLRGDLVFSQEDGSMLTKGECKHPLWRACKRAGLRRIGWHVLRHTFASHLAMRGKPMKVIQELLGHATMEMTMRYAHLAPAVHRDAVAALDGPSPFQVDSEDAIG